MSIYIAQWLELGARCPPSKANIWRCPPGKFDRSRAAASLCYGMFTNTTLSFSSMAGRVEKVEFYGHPIVDIAPTVYGHPHTNIL
ncbi:hypothetical protein EJB05_54003, partial [Eragrostis curvula]